MAVEWSYYNKFSDILDKYLPPVGEGEKMRDQIVTAVNKLVYKWYNDGDVFDNTYSLEGGANDLSSYANWLYKYADYANFILDGIEDCYSEDDYENLLKELADLCLNEDYLSSYDVGKLDSIYDCDGRFEFEWGNEYEDEEEDDYYEDEEYEDDFDDYDSEYEPEEEETEEDLYGHY